MLFYSSIYVVVEIFAFVDKILTREDGNFLAYIALSDDVHFSIVLQRQFGLFLNSSERDSVTY